MEIASNYISVNELFKLMKWNSLYDKTLVSCTYGEKVVYLTEPSFSNKYFNEFMEMF